MTKKNRERLNKHYKSIGGNNPYNKERKVLEPLPPIDDPKDPEEEKKDA